MPATCHSFKSRYSLIASAARNDRLRPVHLASFSSRFLMTGSIRTLTVVEDMSCLCRLCLIVYILHKSAMDDNVRALQAYKSSDRLDASLRLRLSEPNPDPAACIIVEEMDTSGRCIGNNRLDLVEFLADLALGDFHIITVLEIHPESVSYTHLTLPTKRIV